MPATQMGHSSAIAPATNIPQPKRISASALSGARRLRGCAGSALGPSVGEPDELEPREPNPEERAAPFPDERLGRLGAPFVADLDDAPRRVARAGERAGELGVHGLGAGGRREAEGVLARAVQPVLETAEHLDLLLVLQPLGLGGDRLEPRQRVREAGPQGADLCCVSLPGPRPRSHGFNPRRADPRRTKARFPNLYDRRTVTDAGPLILVVEDDASIRLLCRINLELDGFRVEEAATVAGARAAVAAERPALVVLDLWLGVEDAGDLLDELARRRAAGRPAERARPTRSATATARPR